MSRAFAFAAKPPADALSCVLRFSSSPLAFCMAPPVVLKKPRSFLQMCKKCLRNTQMFSHDIDRARQWSDDLVRWEATGWGDASNAMRRISTRTGIPFGKLWALRYRPPKEIASHVLSRLQAAHAAAQERELRKLAHDVTLTARVAGPDHSAVAAAAAVLRAHGGAAAADALAELDGASSGAPSRATGPQIGSAARADLNDRRPERRP